MPIASEAIPSLVTPEIVDVGGIVLNRNESTPTVVIKRCTAIAFFSASLAGVAFALPLVPAQAKADVLATARTWMPVFSSAQAVYLDSKIRNHPTAPFRFSVDFSKKLSDLSQKSGLVYLVVAAQEGTETIPVGTKLGTAKIDELLPRWSSTAGFPRQNYVVLFWVRRSHDPTKGSVGVNVGSKARTLGITPEQLSRTDGLVTPALKLYMPQDPEAALLSIADTMNEKIQSVREDPIVTVTQDEPLDAETALNIPSKDRSLTTFSNR
jgi:hypothetical protein